MATAGQFAGLMSALIADVLNGAVTPGVCNAAVNAGGKLLKVVEMQQRYGTVTANGKELVLTPGGATPAEQAEPQDSKTQRIAELEAELASLRNGRPARV